MANYELLSVEADSKTVKGTVSEILTGILYLAPAQEADGIHDLCPMSTPECEKVCLYGQGMAGVFPSIKRARIAKTLRYLADPNAFALALGRDVERLVREAKARGMKPAVRINGTSDLPKLAKVVAHRYPEVQFYDYTKIPKPWLRVTDNYHLTFSFSGTNERDCIAALEHGVNVAVVFHGALPDTWQGYKVVDGDKNDLRFLDPKGVVVGLKAKGAARKAEVGGFIQIGAPKPKYQSTAVATRKEVEAILAMGRTDVAV